MKTYEDGLNGAWSAARKIFVPVAKGGLSVAEINKIFNEVRAPYHIFDNYSASEAIAKIKEYEENQKQSDDEIKVGDEIYSLDKNYKSVVTAIFDTCRGVSAVYFTQNGKLAELADLVNDCYNMDIKRYDSYKKYGLERKEKNTYRCQCDRCGKIMVYKGYRAPKWYKHPLGYTHTCPDGGKSEITSEYFGALDEELAKLKIYG